MRFNQPITVCWPDSLQEISFVGKRDLTHFSQHEHSFKEQYDVLSNFNLPIGPVAWPASLRSLTFGGVLSSASYRCRLAVIAKGPNLQPLFFSLPCENFEWPLSRKQLTIARRPNEALPTWPGVRVTSFRGAFWEV